MPAAPPASGTWDEVRAHFDLDPELVHMSGLLLASNPTPVREAIAEHRRACDEDPARYVQANNIRLKARVRRAAARYMGTRPNEIALTDSTTMGTALVIMGLAIREDQEMLSARFDYHVTHQSIEFQAARSGASHRRVPLYRDIQRATREEIIEALLSEVRPNTRLVTATWVHSATGLLMPIRPIADRIAELNERRRDDDRVLFFVDGVHGLGVEDVDIPELGCDFFSAGTHKWLHGPRGTGVLWGHPRAHAAVRPTIPTFTRDAGWGGRMSPGGFKPFEHEWAMAEAFDFHREIGRDRIRDRIHGLASELKHRLADMPHVTLRSPLDDELTAGIVCFDVRGYRAGEAARALRHRNVIASSTPYSPSHVRLAPGIYNTESDVDEALRAVRSLA
jgi:isopenicillin-N epimerase